MSILPTKEFRFLQSSWALIGSNLIVLLMAIVFEWTVLNIVLAFVIENVFIGLFNIPKIFLAKMQHPGHRPDNLGSKIMILVLFLFQFGIFVLLHLFLTLIIFGSIEQGLSPSLIVKNQFDIFYLIGLSAIFISHGYSFYSNFLMKKEFEKYSPFQMMLKPFIRVFVIHGFIFLGGYIILFFEESRPILIVIFIAFKTFLDLGAHQKEHKNTLKH